MGTILVVEDDENLRLALQDNLETEGYDVSTAARGADAEALWSEGDFDLVVLDLMLPDVDGYTLCRRLRARGSSARVLMLTARTLEEDVVRGLDVGADDYLAKPYRLGELLARVRALLRRAGAAAPDAGSGVYSFGELRPDLAARSVTGPDGKELALTRKELDLLGFLLHNAGRALGRQEILDAVWGEDVIVDGRSVDNFVSNLKRKLGWRPGAGYRIATVRGVGYRMEVDSPRRPPA